MKSPGVLRMNSPIKVSLTALLDREALLRKSFKSSIQGFPRA